MPRQDFVYFLHIPKTAGTSLHSFLADKVGTDQATRQLLWDDIARGNSPITEATEIVTGHFAGLLPLWYRTWPRIITVVREPLARSLSHINHVRRAPDHPLHERAKGLDVVEYCADPTLRTTIADFQARYLASLQFSRILLDPGAVDGAPGRMSVAFEHALSGLDATLGLEAAAIGALDSIDAVGVTDELERSAELFARVLGWASPTPISRVNVAASGDQRLEDLRPDEITALRELTSIDRRVYQHAQKRLAAQCEALALV